MLTGANVQLCQINGDRHIPISLTCGNMTKTTLYPVTSEGTSLATLQVLGGFSLHDAAGHPIELKARKSRLLLAYIAVPSGQPRSREQLAALLWSDRQEEQARGSLRTALSGIRRALGDDCLILEHDTVGLQAGYLDTDYDQLKSFAEGGRDISRCADFYAGEFLAGQEHDSELFADWQRTLRAECVNLAIKVLEDNATRRADRGDNQAAIDLMRDSLSLEPLKEQTHRTVMKLYAKIGERAMALAQFRTCKELLLRELNTEPDPETISLADSIALKDGSDVISIRGGMPRAVPISANIVDDSTLSIAVLPFVNMSGDAEQQYFADGITEDIITDLSDVDALSIAAKSASQMYRGAPVSPVQISKELGVRYILEGSVRKAGDSVRISAQLMDARTNLQIWAERYDRQLENIFQLQSEISQAIVGALEIKLVTAPQNVTEKRTTTNVDAYQHYLRGQVLLKDHSKDELEAAFESFKQAFALDPKYALAYVNASICASLLTLHYDVDKKVLADALAYSNEALKINPALAEGYSALGYAQIMETNFKEAKVNLDKAIVLAPELAQTYHHLGKYHLSTAGGITQAYPAFKQSYMLDPDLSSGMMALSCLHGLDFPDELQRFAIEILELAERRFSLDPHNFIAANMAAFALIDLNRMDEAMHWVKIATAFNTDDGSVAYNLACLHSILGSLDESLMLLEKTLELGCNIQKIRFMQYTDPDLNLVREDPRFSELLAKFGHTLRARKS